MNVHEAGFVHRDLKPGNIMWLPSQNRWTLIDFGCAAKIGEEAPMGFSLTYAAPEVIKAHFRDNLKSIVATEALDAWSVGVLAVELFTGQPPIRKFEGQKKVCAYALKLQYMLFGSLFARLLQYCRFNCKTK